MLGSSFTRALDGTVPPATRALLGTLLLASSFFLFFVSARDAAGDDGALQYPWIVVVPGKVMYYPWTLLVAGFAETSFLQVSNGISNGVHSDAMRFPVTLLPAHGCQYANF